MSKYRPIPAKTPAHEARFVTAVPEWGRSGCWEWTRALNLYGYGAFGIDGGVYSAHRVSMAWFGPGVSDELEVMHLCDNRRCVNPSHLSTGTHLANMVDMAQKSRDSGKLTERQRRDITADPRLQRVIAADYGVTQAAISYIKNRKADQWNQTSSSLSLGSKRTSEGSASPAPRTGNSTTRTVVSTR